jgi:hypothetical protein
VTLASESASLARLDSVECGGCGEGSLEGTCSSRPGMCNSIGLCGVFVRCGIRAKTSLGLEHLDESAAVATAAGASFWLASLLVLVFLRLRVFFLAYDASRMPLRASILRFFVSFSSVFTSRLDGSKLNVESSRWSGSSLRRS